MPLNNDKLTKALSLQNLPAGEREEILKKVDERLNTVLIGVLVANITDEDAIKIQNALHNEKTDLEEIVAEISMRIPGLAAKIEMAIEEEIVRLKEVLRQ